MPIIDFCWKMSVHFSVPTKCGLFFFSSQFYSTFQHHQKQQSRHIAPSAAPSKPKVSKAAVAGQQSGSGGSAKRLWRGGVAALAGRWLGGVLATGLCRWCARVPGWLFLLGIFILWRVLLVLPLRVVASYLCTSVLS